MSIVYQIVGRSQAFLEATDVLYYLDYAYQSLHQPNNILDSIAEHHNVDSDLSYQSRIYRIFYRLDAENGRWSCQTVSL